MQRQTTTRRRSSPTAAIVCFVLIPLALMATVVIGNQMRADEPTGTVDATDGDPYYFVPSPTPVPPLHLELALPPLSDRQAKYRHAADVLPSCPLCFGVDQPPIPLSDNERAVFVALLFTESRLDPYEPDGSLKVSSAGCIGIAQLCGDLLTPATRQSDELSIYTAAKYWRELLDETGGDFTAALRRYKGITTPDTAWQADTVFALIRLRGGG